MGVVDAATLAVHVAHVLGDELKPRAQHTSVQYSGYSLTRQLYHSTQVARSLAYLVVT